MKLHVKPRTCHCWDWRKPQQTMSSTCHVAILSCVKTASFFFFQSTVFLSCPLLFFQSLTEGWVKSPVLTKRSRGCHRCLRAIPYLPYMSISWYNSSGARNLSGSSQWLKSLKEHWLEITVTTLRFELFLYLLKSICVPPSCRIPE